MVPVLAVRQVPLTATQPFVTLRPFAKVEVAVVERMLRTFAERPPAKVEVPCPAPTVIAAAKVEVAVVEVGVQVVDTKEYYRAL